MAVWSTVAAAIALGFAAGSEALVRYAVEPNDLWQRHLGLFQDSAAGDAVFGDSHAALGFTGVDGFVNLAFPGENLTTIVAKARRYYRDRTPGRVILQADPSMFAGARDAEPPRSYDAAAGAEPWLRMTSPRHRPRLLQYWRVWRSKAGFRASRELQPDGAQTVRTRLDTVAPARRRGDTLSEVQKQRPLADLSASRGLPALDGLIGDLLRRGARVCLATFPVTPLYRRLAAERPEFAAARGAIAALARRRGVARADFWAGVDDLALFSNQDHLNEAGARRLAPAIVRACFG